MTGFHLKPWVLSVGPERFHDYLVEVSKLLEKGTLVPLSGESFTLDAASKAVQEASKPARGGKGFIKS